VDQNVTLYCSVASALEVPVDAVQAGRAILPRLADPQHLVKLELSLKSAIAVDVLSERESVTSTSMMRHSYAKWSHISAPCARIVKRVDNFNVVRW